MIESLETLLALATPASRQQWIQEQYPQADAALVQQLREESYRRERVDPRQALPIAAAITALAAVWGDPATQAVALLVEANARRLLAEHEQALTLYQQAAAIYQQAGLALDAARAAVGQLDPLLYLGRYEDALVLADSAIAQFRQAGDDLFLGRMLMNRGNIFARLNQYPQARSDYGEARALFTTLQAGQFLAMVNANEANVLTNLDEFRPAEDLLQQARSHFADAGMTNAVAQVDQNLAFLYFSQGEYQRALIIFNRAHAVLTAQENWVDAAYVDLDRSVTYLALNLWQEALEITRRARAIFAANHMPWETAQLWLNEAAALMHIHSMLEIYAALDQAKAIFAQEKNSLWLAITDLYAASFEVRNQNFVAVRTYIERARPIFQGLGLRSRVAQCEILLGEVALAQNDYQQAQQYFTQGLAAVAESDLPAITYAGYYGLGRVHRRQGKLTEATRELEISIAAIERLQMTIGAEDYKIAFLHDKVAVYEELILLCLSLGTRDAEELAFATVERAKARALLDAIVREPLAPENSTAETGLLTELANLKRELNWYYNRLNHPQAPGEGRSPAQIAGITAAISEREQALGQLLNRLRSPDLIDVPHNSIGTVQCSQIQASLPPNVLLLEFYTAQEQVVVFGLTATTLWTVTLSISCSDLADLLSQFRYQLGKFNFGPAYRQRHAATLRQNTNASLHRLYQALICPIKDRLRAETLVIVPHNILHYVPFHALFDGEHYLLEEKLIAYAPSATILHRVLALSDQECAGRPLVIGIDDATIPHAQSEAETVAALFPTADLRIGRAATVASLLQPPQRPAFLHISTHATFRTDNPLFSALKLEDGWATVHDIYSMAAAAPLVILSACETGQTQVSAGDELMGLCRGFFSAGAQSLVVSQWMVDDTSAAQLMKSFYHYLQQGLTAHRALQLAQQRSLAEYAHPYYWAPFIVMGNPWIHLSAALCVPVVPAEQS